MKTGGIECSGMEVDEERSESCVIKRLCYEIINSQNNQIQTMRRVLDSLNYAPEDEHDVPSEVDDVALRGAT